MLNCKLGSWPMRYLGGPISDSRIGISGFGGLKQKMAKRPDPWRGKHLSSGGKLVLTISCLSSLPIFMMGFYLLPKSVHKWMDSLRGKFFWQGAKEEFKYHMASWDSVSRPKDKGGLGIINTKLMNECLLVKWIWKITKGSSDVWFKLLDAKYVQEGNFFTSRTLGSSQFWQGLHKVKHLFKWGAIHKMKDGYKTSFWHDVWIGDSPLRLQYPSLYNMCRDKEALVADYYKDGDWEIEFRRSLLGSESECLDLLIQSLQHIQVDTEQQDDVEWALDTSKSFTTKSLYRFLTHRGVQVKEADNIWKTSLPMKIKVFLWQLSHNKLQSVVALKRRGWKGSTRYALCGRHESVSHIFFTCSSAHFVWACLSEVFGGTIPCSWDELHGGKLTSMFKTNMRLSLFLFAGIAWSIWRTRNKMAIEKIFSQNPIDVVYLGISFVQKWWRLLKPADQEKLSKAVDTMRGWLRSYNPISLVASDIVEI